MKATTFQVREVRACILVVEPHVAATREAHLLLGGAAGIWRRIGWRDLGVPLYYGMRELNTYHDRCTSRLAELMGADEVEVALKEGATTSVNDLIADALGESRGGKSERASSTGTDLPALTKREKEVAELVTHGLSNKEIAAKLFIWSSPVGWCTRSDPSWLVGQAVRAWMTVSFTSSVATSTV